MTPDKDRKAAERARKRAAGLTPFELWAPPQHHDAIRRYAARLANGAVVLVNKKRYFAKG